MMYDRKSPSLSKDVELGIIRCSIGADLVQLGQWTDLEIVAERSDLRHDRGEEDAPHDPIETLAERRQDASDHDEHPSPRDDRQVLVATQAHHDPFRGEYGTIQEV